MCVCVCVCVCACVCDFFGCLNALCVHVRDVMVVCSVRALLMFDALHTACICKPSFNAHNIINACH